MISKGRGASIDSSTRKISHPLELVHLDISEKVEQSMHNDMDTIAFLDGFTAKCDVNILKEKNELFANTRGTVWVLFRKRTKKSELSSQKNI